MTGNNPEDYINYRMERALETIEEVRTHINNKYYNTAINRMYYASYFMLIKLKIRIYLFPVLIFGR